MEQTSVRATKERLVAILFAALGLYAVAASWTSYAVNAIHLEQYVLSLCFAIAIILLDRYPIHLLRGTKVSLNNLPIFLSVALLPAQLIMIVTGVGLLVANLLARVERGLLLRDIISTLGQWLLTALIGYRIVHFSVPGLHWNASILSRLLLDVLVFLSLDFLAFSLFQSFVYDEPFLITLRSVIFHGISLEALQYLLGVLGALAAFKDIWSVILLIVPISITYLAFKNIKETHFETVQILEDLADTVDLRDRYTGGHSKGVAELVHQTLLKMKISGPEATLIEIAARLHDVGKIGIPDSILRKPGKLFPEEMAVMRTHPRKGAELIAKYKDFSRGALMIMHHHERWDGGGYPGGLKEYAIPFGARVISVADSFDAMTSDRPYRKAMSTFHAIQILLEGRGTQWDPQVVNAFVDMILEAEDRKSTERRSATGIPSGSRQDAPASF